MKRLLYIIIFLSIFICVPKLNAQLIQFGLRTQTDLRNDAMPFHNFSVGPQLDVNIPLVGFGVGVSAMLTYRGLDNIFPDILDKTYEYAYIPLNFKWRFGPRVFRVVIAAGPYVFLPLNSKIKDEINLEKQSQATLWGVNVQIGAEILNKVRLSIGFRSDTYQSYLEDFVNREHGFYLDLFFIL